jgi:hypothetical protein
MYNGLIIAEIPHEQLFIGISTATSREGHCAVAVRGYPYNNTADISNYIGKNVYLNINSVDQAWPANITDSAFGNLHIGLCISKNKILIKGL